MSADHRRPVVAFVVLAFLAAAVVGIHRADADDAQFLTSVLGRTGQVDGRLPADGPSDGPGDAELLEVPQDWFDTDELGGAGQDTPRSAVRDGRAAEPTRGQAGHEGRPAVRQKSSSGPAAAPAPRRAANPPTDSPRSPRSLTAVEEAADEAVRDVTRRDRSDGDRSSTPSRRTVEMTAETVEKTVTKTVETTETLVREVGDLARLD